MSGAGDELDEYTKRKRTTFSRPLPSYTGVPTDEYNDRREKPWQRVPNAFIIVVLGVYLLLGYLTQLVEDDMPRVIREADVARSDWQTFSEESALRYLGEILGDEPRVAGTKYHLDKSLDMFSIVNTIAAQANLPVKTDLQVVSGDFWLNFGMPFVNYYQNVSNVIAVLEGDSGFYANGTIGPSLLVNCHYDSVPFAMGASDNGVFCAVMAESLLRLSRRSSKFRHNIIFLFNGAEENPLQGSHAFLQHPWASGVTAVINLDAGGMNGKPSVFQVTDPRILSAYSRSAYRPSAQGVGEFLFTSGIIPSDTDFRVFRDFGQIQGIDIAFTKWGHVYHTRYDHPSLILPGVVQNAGNMLLALLAEAADANLDQKMESTPMVYLDFLNLFAVTYTYPVSHAVDVLVAVFGLMSVAYYVWLVGLRWSTVEELFLALGGRLCSLLAGVGLVLVLTAIMVATTIQMRYLSQAWIVVPMFWIPYLVGTVAVSHLYDAWRTKKSGLNRSIRTLQAMAATRLLLSTILLIMACIPSVTPLRYVLSGPLFMMSLGSLVSLTLVRYVRLQGWQHLLLELAMSIPSVMFVFTLALRLVAMMIPIMGRSSGDNPDYIVAFLNLGMAILVGVIVSGVELLFSRKRLWLPLTVMLVSCVIIMLVPFSPYQDHGPATQRHYWFHTKLATFNIDKVPVEQSTGVLVSKLDPYTTSRVSSALTAAGLHYNTRTDFTEDCQNKVYCGLPLFKTAFGRHLPKALWLYTGAPASLQPAPDVTLANKQCVGDICTYDFTFAVSHHNLITIWPRDNVTLSSWSLSSPVRSSLSVRGRPVYVIVHSVATYTEHLQPLQLKLTLRIPPSLQSQPTVEVSLHYHLIHHSSAFTPEYRALLEAAPKYFNIASFISYRHDYVF